MNKTDHNCILFFVKYLTPGEVKTRLAEVLGDIAAELYRCFVADMLKMLGTVNLPLFVFCDPDTPLDRYRQWLGQYYTCIHQNGSDIGQRMKNAFAYTFKNHHYEKVVLIGSDFPDLPPEYIARPFKALDTNKIVIGPADNGGYYLIGFRGDSYLPDVFDAIQWSGPEVLEQTLSNIARHRMLETTCVLNQWHDVDTIDDLKKLIVRAETSPFKKSETMKYISKQMGITFDNNSALKKTDE